MTNKKKGGKAFYTALVALMLCCAMFLGSTYAWFSNTVENTNNKIVVGVLDVELYQVTQDGESVMETKITETTDLFDGIKWQPGTVCYRNLTVKNEGDLAFNYELVLNWGDHNTLDGKSLDGVLKVAVLEGHVEGSGEEAEKTALEKAAEAEWNGLTETLTGALEGLTVAGDTETINADQFAIVVYWEPTASDSDYNACNGKKTTDGEPLYQKLGLTLIATQKNAD